MIPEQFTVHTVPSKLNTLHLAQIAHADTNIYHQKNIEANHRGDCKQNVERLLVFFQASGLDLDEFTVVFVVRRNEEGHAIRLAVDKAALRSEEQALMLRQVFTGDYRRKQMLWKLHFLVLDKEKRV